MLQTFRSSANHWFNWRNTTGACKLYDSYDTIYIHWFSEDDTLFHIQVPSQSGQVVGTWDVDDNELYIRHNNRCREWKFVYIDESMLDRVEKLMLECHLRLGC